MTSRLVHVMLQKRNRFWPLALTLVLVLLWLGASVWRYALMAGALSAILAAVWFERRGRRVAGRRECSLAPGPDGSAPGARTGGTGAGEPIFRQALSDLQVGVTAWAMGIAQLTFVLVLGGVAGPVAPALPLIALVMNLFAPGRIAAYFVLLVQVPAVWLFAWAQSSGAIPDLVPDAWAGLFVRSGTPGPGPWIGATFISAMLIGATGIGRVLRGVVMDLLREQIDERDAQLEIHADSARTLSRLSAEIAHELKNPLASIKGLASLVRKDLAGVPAERMDVLRREVDRLQGILEEFLNYSRPLVPLDEERVDLVDLAADVVALHEATAVQRGVQLGAPEHEGGAVHLRCDPRKIRQVVINLVQNAIDATPRGGRVRVEIERDEGGAAIRVRDEGPGLAEGAAEKIFRVGFTTKPEGSGIGLAVARGLARQHGGELSLEDGARGCVATLRLPAVPSAALESAASREGGAA